MGLNTGELEPNTRPLETDSSTSTEPTPEIILPPTTEADFVKLLSEYILSQISLPKSTFYDRGFSTNILNRLRAIFDKAKISNQSPLIDLSKSLSTAISELAQQFETARSPEVIIHGSTISFVIENKDLDSPIKFCRIDIQVKESRGDEYVVVTLTFKEDANTSSEPLHPTISFSSDIQGRRGHEAISFTPVIKITSFGRSATRTEEVVHGILGEPKQPEVIDLKPYFAILGIQSDSSIFVTTNADLAYQFNESPSSTIQQLIDVQLRKIVTWAAQFESEKTKNDPEYASWHAPVTHLDLDEEVLSDYIDSAIKQYHFSISRENLDLLIDIFEKQFPFLKGHFIKAETESTLLPDEENAQDRKDFEINPIIALQQLEEMARKNRIEKFITMLVFLISTTFIYSEETQPGGIQFKEMDMTDTFKLLYYFILAGGSIYHLFSLLSDIHASAAFDVVRKNQNEEGKDDE